MQATDGAVRTCSHRSSMALPPVPSCRDYSVTESALSGCLSASRPHTHGSFRRWHIRSRYARFDARSSIKPSVLAALGGIDAACPMPHSSTTSILTRRLRLQGTSPIPAANLTSLGRRRCSLRRGQLITYRVTAARKRINSLQLACSSIDRVNQSLIFSIPTTFDV